ncbi:MazG family protein [Pseudoclavibacter soli]|uniref:MazG family protein n=1 Tax=Pseudoclavibacter soli TaxID=452623 RepID=UPI000400A5DE|nr:MazG family protein [Pseudoclavibacter soli]
MSDSQLFSNAPSAGGSALDGLVDTVDQLLREGGCPWDREQTHESLAKYLLEETYETLDAIESDDGSPEATQALVEELGDVLYQVLFHARLAQTEGRFDIDDVARAVDQKMRARHPHVFGDAEGNRPVAETADDVVGIWDAAKAREKSSRTSVLDGIPQALPALSLADKLIGRAHKLGLLDASVPGAVPVTDEDDLGKLLLAIVASAKAAGLDSERALRTTLRGFADEIHAAEQAGADAGVIGVSEG